MSPTGGLVLQGHNVHLEECHLLLNVSLLQE
jgi:hypothetical protein